MKTLKMKIEQWLEVCKASSDAPDDSFLIDEGFDLLAAYRAIEDADLRKSILLMIAQIAETQKKRS